jgi:esterase/lipase superfamily enzyme
MTDAQNRQFLETLTARLPEIEPLLADQWPQVRELLASIQRRIAEATSLADVSEGIDDILDLLVDTAAGPVIRDILRDVAAGDTTRGVTFRGGVAAVIAESALPADESAAAGQAALDTLDPFTAGPLTVVPILYATDRQRSAKGFYGSERGTLELGVATVSIPIDNRVGTLPQPRWWRLEFTHDPTRHVIVLSAESRERQVVLDDLRHALADDPESGVLLYVHGYNTTFVDAARRAAQLAYDLKYRGVPMVYSWPSIGRVLRYTADETNVTWSQPHLEELLRMLIDYIPSITLDIIAHSMGTRAVMGAVGALNLNPGASPLRHLVLAAPDIDADTFREVAAKFTGRARRFTLYASSRDWALWFSRRFHGYTRAGESGEHLVIVRPTLDTIDASLVDTSLMGHSYYGDNRSIVSDIFAMLRGQDAPPRFGMTSHTTAAGEYWLFRP